MSSSLSAGWEGVKEQEEDASCSSSRVSILPSPWPFCSQHVIIRGKSGLMQTMGSLILWDVAGESRATCAYKQSIALKKSKWHADAAQLDWIHCYSKARWWLQVEQEASRQQNGMKEQCSDPIPSYLTWELRAPNSWRDLVFALARNRLFTLSCVRHIIVDKGHFLPSSFLRHHDHHQLLWCYRSQCLAFVAAPLSIDLVSKILLLSGIQCRQHYELDFAQATLGFEPMTNCLDKVVGGQG